MSEYVIERHRKGNLIVDISQDDSPDDPRNWDNIGHMVCFHREYKLGDKTNVTSDDFSSWGELEKHLETEENAKIILPLYLYDHSGLRMKVGSFEGLLPQGHAEFDSGMIGFIYATDADIKREGMSKEKVKKYLEGEVETYDQYLSGDVYSFRAYELNRCDSCAHTDEEMVDAVGGFFGIESVHDELRSMYPDFDKWETENSPNVKPEYRELSEAEQHKLNKEKAMKMPGQMKLPSMNPKGWHKEPINHALASKGIKVGKSRTKR